MNWNVWYDLAIQELCELSSHATEQLAEAEKVRGAVPPEAEPVPVSGESA